MSNNLKLILGFIYLLCLGVLLIFLFSNLDIKDLSDYSYIKKNSEELLNLKKNNLILFMFVFFIFSILWIFLLGFAGPVAILSGFVFGKWLGTIISVTAFAVGSTFLYVFANYYFRNVVIEYLEKKIDKYKNLFKKNELIYFMIFRFAGGGGLPFGIQNILPVVFDIKVKNYFNATILGLFPSVFIINSLGSGLEKLIEENDSLSYKSIIFNPDIYWPIFGFLFILVTSFFIRRKFFKKK
tara:strand:- start:124 stop:843 length:720 start_codon:yes stop_codon:yes gene_type:complete